MKWLVACIMLLSAGSAHGFGVLVLDAEVPDLLPPFEADYDVYVENQVAVTHLHGEYINSRNDAVEPVWVFPLPAEASATRLRYRMNGLWTEVPIAVGPQDPGLPGDQIHPSLLTFMGHTPLVFHFEHALPPDSTLIVELDYVELLPYEYGTVSMRHPANLRPVLPNQSVESGFHLTLNSDRDLVSLGLTSGHAGSQVVMEGGSGEISWHDISDAPDEDFTVEYQLDQNQLGLFATSTMLPDSLMPEEGPRGFLMFLVEPDPDDQEAVMDKVFTLILDRSGSMAGNKIIQARGAASFIVQHLNEGDQFNLISFNNNIFSFLPQHVPYTPANESAALTWIDNLLASGSTNISGAFQTAVPQFDADNDSTANIIIFLTDGQPTTGITDIPQLVEYVDGLFEAQPRPISLFCFGIGTDVNQPLLGQLAAHNDGFAEFLQNDELESRISDFYLTVRNPVLMNPWLTTSPDILQLTAPQPLPSLYTGHQLIVAARYAAPQPLLLSLHGTAFGQSLQYDYPIELAAGYAEDRAFLTKVWAKRTIEALMVAYYQLDPESSPALELREEIIAMSVLWGVVSPFTSFNDDTVLPEEDPAARPGSLLLLESFPNPFNPSTTLRITVPAGVARGPLVVRVYNLRGALVRTLALVVSGPGVYELVWDGRDEQGLQVASGSYLMMVSCADQVASHRVLLLK